MMVLQTDIGIQDLKFMNGNSLHLSNISKILFVNNGEFQIKNNDFMWNMYVFVCKFLNYS